MIFRKFSFFIGPNMRSGPFQNTDTTFFLNRCVRLFCDGSSVFDNCIAVADIAFYRIIVFEKVLYILSNIDNYSKC